MSFKSIAPLIALALSLSFAGCTSGPSYYRVLGESDVKEPAESISFEIRDYGDLARLFVKELEGHPLCPQLRGDPTSNASPAIAHKEFRIDMADRNTKVSIMEQRIRVELQRIGIRYIDEEQRQQMIESIKLQQSDLNDKQGAAAFGKFANAKFYLVGRLYEVTHEISRTQKKQEFHLVVDLVETETLISRFACDVAVTKYMER
jgi:hypothetical protein